MKIKHSFLYIIFLFFWIPVKADFINKIRPDQCETIIEIYVEDGQIRVTYEVGLKDWKYFKEIIPDELLNQKIREYIQSLGKNYFYNNVFTLNADGKITLTTWNSDTGRVSLNANGVIPLVEGKIEMTFVDLDDASATPKTWTLIDQGLPENVQYGYCTPLTDAQLQNMGLD